MTHRERHERRQRIAKAVESGESLIDVALKEKVTVEIVKDFCREFGITLRQKKSIKTLQILKHLLDGISGEDIAKHYGVSKQWVNEIRKDAREAGFVFVKYSKGKMQ